MKPEHESSLRRLIAGIDAVVLFRGHGGLSDALIEDLKARFDAYEEEA